ncbi:MAG: hypothetical protein ACYDGR_02735 [Candidatus Dormibacteria bacterium]
MTSSSRFRLSLATAATSVVAMAAPLMPSSGGSMTTLQQLQPTHSIRQTTPGEHWSRVPCVPRCVAATTPGGRAVQLRPALSTPLVAPAVPGVPSAISPLSLLPKPHVMHTVEQVKLLRTRSEYFGVVQCAVECLAPMISGGGAVQHNPSAYIVYWGWHGSDPAEEASYLQRFLDGVGGSSWANIQTQYNGTTGYVTNPASQLKGVWNDDSTTPSHIIADADIAAEAVRAAAHFGYDRDADYFVATPHGTGTSGFAGVSNGATGYCAYHNSTQGPSGTVAFINLPYIPDAGTGCGQDAVNANGPLDGVSIVAGHEYAEAVTDPVSGTGWSDVTGEENGDKCAWIMAGPGVAANISLSTGSFAVQSLYSNAANLGTVGGCVLSYP